MIVMAEFKRLDEVDLSKWQDEMCKDIENFIKKLDLLKGFRVAVVTAEVEKERKYFILVEQPAEKGCMGYDAFKEKIYKRLIEALRLMFSKEDIENHRIEVAYRCEPPKE